MSVDTVQLLQIGFVLVVVIAGSLVWAKENGHSPLKAAPVWIGFAVLGASVYLLDQQFSGSQSDAEMLDHEAVLETLSGWIIVAILCGLGFLFILRMLITSQSKNIKEAK